MAANSKKTELLVGIFLFVGILLLSLLVLQFGRIGDLLRGSYDIRVEQMIRK